MPTDDNLPIKFYVQGNSLIAEGDWPTDKRTALRVSIAKWETLAAWHAEAEINDPDFSTYVFNVHARSCALCHLYLPGQIPTATAKSDCAGCPVSDHTSIGYCTDTPYEKYDGCIGGHAEYQQAAQEEADFLKQLLAKLDEADHAQ